MIMQSEGAGEGSPFRTVFRTTVTEESTNIITYIRSMADENWIASWIETSRRAIAIVKSG